MIETIAVDPVRQRLIDGSAKAEADHIDVYGYIVHHPYWGPPVNGDRTAIMGDCMDERNFGTVDIESGKKLSTGTANVNTHVVLTQSASGEWRVQDIQDLDAKC